MVSQTRLARLSHDGRRYQVAEPSSSENQSADEADGRHTLDYDVGKFAETAGYVKFVIYVTLLIMAVCLAGSVVILVIGQDRHRFHFRMSDGTSEVILFFASFLVTLCSDGLGYVHSTSLRWALYAEGKLKYNTNFRFFKSATWKEHYANKWPMNLLCAASLLLSYASVSLLLARSDYWDPTCVNPDPDDEHYYDFFTSDDYEDAGCYVNDFSTNVIALAGLGFGLCGQFITAALCLRHHQRRILSWNPNPLWNTYAMQRTEHLHLRIHRTTARCMQSVFDSEDQGRQAPVVSKRPGEGKRCLWHLPSTRRIVLAVWLLCIITFVWPAIIVLITQDQDDAFRFSWDRELMERPETRYRQGIYTWFLNGSESTYNDFPIGVQYLIGILFLCGIQLLLLLGLHCVELLVNLSRDEFVWRKASKPGGSSPAAEGPLFAAVTSWRTVFLTLLKALLHWIIGQCVVPEYWGDVSYDYGEEEEENVSLFAFVMSAPRLVFFGIVMLVLAAFATAMAFWPVHGYQPVTWGHLPTLVDLVDDWGLPGSTLFWGDKPVSNGSGRYESSRHAGTVGRHEVLTKLDPKGIRSDALYGGPGCCPPSLPRGLY